MGSHCGVPALFTTSQHGEAKYPSDMDAYQFSSFPIDFGTVRLPSSFSFILISFLTYVGLSDARGKVLCREPTRFATPV